MRQRSTILRRTVGFGGSPDRSGPVTLGQANVLQWLGDSRSENAVLTLFVDIPPGPDLDDVLAAVAALAGRYESLRTVYPAVPAGAEPVQSVLGAGELHVEVHENGGTATTASAARDLLRRVAAGSQRPFDLTCEVPVRVAVLTDAGRPTTAMVVVSHVATDQTGLMIISRYLQEALSPSGPPLPAPHQPLEQAAAERSPRGQRRAAASVRYWQAQLRRIPVCAFAVPLRAGVATDAPYARLRAPAAAAAVARITARTRASASTVVLAATAALVAHRNGSDTCSLRALSSNRFGAGMDDYLSSMAQEALVVLDVGGASFDEVVRRTATATMRAYLHGLYDAHQVAAASLDIEHDRGVRFCRDFVFNDIQGIAPDVAAAMTEHDTPIGEPQIVWVPFGPLHVPQTSWFLLGVDGELGLAVRADPRLLAPEDVEALLYGVARLLTAAAGRDVAAGQFGQISGVTPVRREPPRWVRVDASWVMPAEVRRLLDDALDAEASAVFALPAGGGGHRLVAHVAPRDRALTPARAHLACMAVLAGRHTAMAPQHYVVHAAAPADPADPAAWHRHPVLAEGDGRR